MPRQRRHRRTRSGITAERRNAGLQRGKCLCSARSSCARKRFHPNERSSMKRIPLLPVKRQPTRPGRTVWATVVTALCVLGVVTLAGSAQAVTPPTVLLGTADQFAVLAGSGITNTGASTISGDVGSSPTHSETGFAACPAADCVTLTGTNHNAADPNDATTQGAKTALTTAYNDAAGRSPSTVLTELAGQTL